MKNSTLWHWYLCSHHWPRLRVKRPGRYTSEWLKLNPNKGSLSWKETKEDSTTNKVRFQGREGIQFKIEKIVSSNVGKRGTGEESVTWGIARGSDRRSCLVGIAMRLRIRIAKLFFFIGEVAGSINKARATIYLLWSASRAEPRKWYKQQTKLKI